MSKPRNLRPVEYEVTLRTIKVTPYKGITEEVIKTIFVKVQRQRHQSAHHLEEEAVASKIKYSGYFKRGWTIKYMRRQS